LSFWVQVWHSIPFKGFAGNELTKKVFNIFDLHPVSSQWLADYYINGIGVHSRKVTITGYARSDDLINKIFDTSIILKEKNLSLHKKTILYAPTWGHESNKPKPLFPWGANEIFLKEFSQFLNRNNLQCIIRTHPNWKEMTQELMRIINKSKNIINSK